MRPVLAVLFSGCALTCGFAAETGSPYNLTITLPAPRNTWQSLTPGPLGRMAGLLHVDPALADLLSAGGVASATQWAAILHGPLADINGLGMGLVHRRWVVQVQEPAGGRVCPAVQELLPEVGPAIRLVDDGPLVRLTGNLTAALYEAGRPRLADLLMGGTPGAFTWEIAASGDTATGTADHLSLPTAQLPLQAVDPHAVQAPRGALASVAFAIDGQELGRQLARLVATLPFNDRTVLAAGLAGFASVGDDRSGDGLAQLAHGLSGTWTLALTASGGDLAWLICGERTPVRDQLIARLLKANGAALPTDGAALLLPGIARHPPLQLRQTPTHWLLASRANLLDQPLAPLAGSTPPAGTRLHAAVDLAQVWRLTGARAIAAGRDSGTDAARRTSRARAATLANRLATIGGTSSLILGPGPGFTATGTNALAAVGLLAAVLDTLDTTSGQWLRQLHDRTFERRLTTLATALQAQPGLSAALIPDLQGWAGHCLTLPAATNALPEQPLAVIDPAATPDGRTRIIHASDPITVVPTARSAAVWAEAVALTAHPLLGPVTARTWAPVLALLGPGTGRTPNLVGPLVDGACNIRVRQLPAPWVQLPATLKDATSIQFSLAKRSAVVAVIAEPLDPEILVDEDTLQATQLATQRALSTALDAEGTVTATIVGRTVTGTRWHLSLRGGGEAWRELYIFATRDAYLQVIVSSPQRDDLAADRELICGALALLDPTRGGPPPIGTPFAAATLPGMGLRVTLPEWYNWSGRSATYPQSATGATHPGPWWCLVYPVRLDGLDPTTDDLADGLLSTFDITRTDAELQRGEHGTDGLQRWQEWTFTRHHEGSPLPFIMRTVRQGDRAWIIGCWAQTGGAPRAAQLAGLFRAVEVIPPDAGQPSPAFCRQEALILNHAGLAAYGAGRNRDALPLFLRASELAPEDPDIAGNICWTHLHLAQSAEGLAFLDHHVVLTAKHHELRSFKAAFLARLERRDEALAAWAALFADGYADGGEFTSYMDLLWEADRHADACAAPERFPAVGGLRLVRLHQAVLRSLDGQHDAAIAQLAALVKTAPGETSARLQLGWALHRAEREAEALTAIAPLTARSDASAEAWRLTGRCQLASGALPAAKESLEKSLAIAPGDQLTQDLLTHVNGKLGTGDSSALRTEIPALALPAVEAVPADFGNDEDAAYVDRTTVFQWRPEQPLVRTERRVVRIATAAGAADFNKLEIRFDPRCDELFINRLVVTDAAGAVVGEGRLADYYLLDDNDGGHGTTKRIAHLPVPGLRPGCTLEWIVSRRSTYSPTTFPYERLPLSAGYPVFSARVVVLGDISTVGVAAINGAVVERTAERTAERIAISARLPLAWHQEPLADDDRRWLPLVELGPAQGTWAAAGAEYLTRITPQLASSPLLHEVAETVCAGIDDPHARCAALTAHVQRTLTYQAIEFGTRGTIPKTAATSLADTFGDCKDHAVLLQQLLAAQGITAWLALANSDHEIEPGLPDLDQFNHMVVAVPDGDGGALRFIDPTSKEADPGLAVAASCTGRTLLLLDPTGPRLVQAGDPAPSTITAKRTIRIAADGTLTIHEVVTFDRYYATWLRTWLSGIPARERLARFQEYLGSERAEVTAVTVLNLEEHAKPLVVTVDYLPKERLSGTAERRSGHLPAIWERANLDVRRSPGRRSPALLSFPLIMRTTVTLEAPAGMQVSLRPTTSDAGDAWYHFNEQLTATGFTAETTQLRIRIPAADWPAYYARTATILQRLEAEVTISRP